MKPSEILRKAAKLVEDGEEFSCWAVSCAIAGIPHPGPECMHAQSLEFAAHPAAKAYAALMGYLPNVHDFVDNEDGYYIAEDEARGHRVIALCMAAAIAESEGK